MIIILAISAIIGYNGIEVYNDNVKLNTKESIESKN
jgi:hypothetical protein